MTKAEPYAYHESRPVSSGDLTIKFFMDEMLAATAKGCTHWATQTDKSGDPWVTRIIFYTPLEEE